MAEKNNPRRLRKPINSAMSSKTLYLGEGFKNPLTQARFLFVFNFVVAALQDFKIRFLHDRRDNVRLKGIASLSFFFLIDLGKVFKYF